MNKDTNGEDLEKQSSTYLEDIRSFSVIVFTISVMTAAIINTQEEMKQLAGLLAFFGFGYLIIGIGAQLTKRNSKRV